MFVKPSSWAISCIAPCPTNSVCLLWYCVNTLSGLCAWITWSGLTWNDLQNGSITNDKVNSNFPWRFQFYHWTYHYFLLGWDMHQVVSIHYAEYEINLFPIGGFFITSFEFWKICLTGRNLSFLVLHLFANFRSNGYTDSDFHLVNKDAYREH